MKINIELDLTPQEARELMGWPDTGTLQQLIMKSVNEKLQSGNQEQIDDIIKPYIEQGQQAFAQYQKFLQGLGGFSDNKQSKPKA